MVRAALRPTRKTKVAPAPQRAALVFRDFVRQLEKLSQKPPRGKPEDAR